MLRSASKDLVFRGIFALIIGIIAVVWPGVTVYALVILFAIAAGADSVSQASRAFSSDGAWPVIGHLLLALIDLAAVIVALAWPGMTAYVLTIFIGAWALVTGGFEIALAFGNDETSGQRALFALGGLLSIALGIALFARPNIGAVSLAIVFGLFSMAYGIASLVTAAELHRTDVTLSDVFN